MPLTRLETLELIGCKFVPVGDAADLTFLLPPPVGLNNIGVHFLPLLKTLKIKERCLGQWSRHFECHRPSLTNLSSNCFHIGLPTVSPLNWAETPNLWPNLRELALNVSDPTAIVSLVDHFGKVRVFGETDSSKICYSPGKFLQQDMSTGVCV